PAARQAARHGHPWLTTSLSLPLPEKVHYDSLSLRVPGIRTSPILRCAKPEVEIRGTWADNSVRQGREKHWRSVVTEHASEYQRGALRRLQNFVAGKEVDSAGGRTMALVDPSTGEPYAEAPLSGPDDVDAACRAAAEAFEGWRDA